MTDRNSELLHCRAIEHAPLVEPAHLVIKHHRERNAANGDAVPLRAKIVDESPLRAEIVEEDESPLRALPVEEP